MALLDSLEPNDLRNGESFNHAEMILDNINQSYYQHFQDNKNPQDFITKSMEKLFRQDSPMITKAIVLAELYLQEHSGSGDKK